MEKTGSVTNSSTSSKKSNYSGLIKKKVILPKKSKELTIETIKIKDRIKPKKIKDQNFKRKQAPTITLPPPTKIKYASSPSRASLEPATPSISASPPSQKRSNSQKKIEFTTKPLTQTSSPVRSLKS